jgi:4-hydroxybenzoate polyprenyltransferase
MRQSFIKKIIDAFFYGNFFAGICAVALCIETSIQHKLAFNGIPFYIIIFLGTSSFYTYLYLKSISPSSNNERTVWYSKNEKVIRIVQKIMLVALAADILFFIIRYFHSFEHLNTIKFGQITLFPLAAFAYTFNLLPFPHAKRLRRIGWLKPFALGFVWSGFVSVYPIVFYQIQTNSHAGFFSLPSGWLWIKNLMFISTLCIMFDIKDRDNDAACGLKTYPVQFGIKNTIRFIIIPLVLLGLLAFFMFTVKKEMPASRIAINAIPYLLLLITAYSLNKKRSIIYYLSVIDGLMLVKAACGIIAMWLIAS